MPRVKRGTQHTKKRKKLLKQTKGYKWGRKKLPKRAKEAVKRAAVHSYQDRKKKKGVRRALWQIKISAAAKENGMSYSKFMGALKKTQIEIDRKILADLAENNPEVFKEIFEKATGEKSKAVIEIKKPTVRKAPVKKPTVKKVAEKKTPVKKSPAKK